MKIGNPADKRSVIPAETTPAKAKDEMLACTSSPEPAMVSLSALTDIGPALPRPSTFPELMLD